ncbi:DUF2249 domain-containing protein [Actinoplanes sp. NPDC048791]|uniref:DUF2249 domain-containing protein n=1 Tax=Actinoplanes sp. NPDC048791 TaxID=3154623 RepID=UPI0033D80F37
MDRRSRWRRCLDVRETKLDWRRALISSMATALSLGDAVVLVASHAPYPVLVKNGDCSGGQIRARRLQSEPEVGQVCLERLAALA